MKLIISDKAKKILFYVGMAFILVLTSFIMGYCTSDHNQGESVIETKIDTIRITSVDTIYIPKEKIKEIEVIIKDTIRITDTILVREEKTYEDEYSTIYISGIEAELDSVEYRIPRDTVIVNKETTKTTIKRKGFGQYVGIGPYVGYGVTTLPSPKFVPSIGISITYGFGYHW